MSPKHIVLSTALSLGLSLSLACATKTETPDPEPAKKSGLMYPTTKTVDHVDDYHGTKVQDPYRWLEDLDSDDTKSWIEEQNKLTFGFLEKIPEREALKERLTGLWNYERYSAPFKEGGRYFYFKNDGLQNQSVLYKMDALDAEPTVLLDPNAWSKEGTTALGGYGFSDDGKWMAYSKSEGGSDWRTWSVINVETGEVQKDEVKWSKFSPASWTHDNKGFFYSRYPAPEGDKLETANYFMKVYYHRVGTSQDEDVLVYEDKANDKRGFWPMVTEDGKYLILHIWEGTDTRNRMYYMKLNADGGFTKTGDVVKLLDGFDADYSLFGNVDDVFYFRTDKDAPKGRVIAIDLKKPAPASWKTILAERDDKLEWASMIGGGILAGWLHQARDMVTFHEMSGEQIREVELPTVGSAGGFSGKSKDTETFYSFTSFTYPSSVFHLDLTTGTSTLFRQPKVDFDPSAYETEQVTYRSKDGTDVPMFLVYKKGLKKDGTNPTYLYGYGGFNISLTPSFAVSRVAWLERGGIYAQPSLRGGGEFGEEWHKAGMFEKKQNVFDDFAAAAEYLIAEKWTSAKKIGIGGGSNGGLLVGASITQRPELFGAALCSVGVLDMLRFHKFTIGHAWTTEYGSADEKEQFPYIYKYSPLHNVKAGVSYPATMIATADHDDRVVPAHSYKFAAELQKGQAGEAPILIRVDTKAGHGAGKSTAMLIEETADKWAFLMEVLEM
jgi:prolyl oligopeptidase